MFSTVTAAQAQFRLESAERDRERSVLSAIRERRSALEAERVRAARIAARQCAAIRRAAWPRPIARRPTARAA